MATVLVFYVGFIAGKIGTFISSTSFLWNLGVFYIQTTTPTVTFDSHLLDLNINFFCIPDCSSPTFQNYSEWSEWTGKSKHLCLLLHLREPSVFLIHNDVSYWLNEKRFYLEAYTFYTRICNILKHYFIVFILVCIRDQVQAHATSVKFEEELSSVIFPIATVGSEDQVQVTSLTQQKLLQPEPSSRTRSANILSWKE